MPYKRAFLIGMLFIILAACQVATPTLPPLQATSTGDNPPSADTPEPSGPPETTPTDSPRPEPTDTSTPTVAPSLPPASQATWQPLTSGLDTPVFITHAGDGSGRLFIIEKPGRLRIFQDGALLPEPFLDITARVGSQGNEQGLLGLAFHPDFAENGYFYLYYTDLNGDTVISRFSRSADTPSQADPGSEIRLLFIPQPFQNHNGGMLAFGPDGYLYIGTGDGGSAGDPQGNGQSLNSLLGKILRVDVASADPYAIPPDNSFIASSLPEIWAYGLRNPWRFSFDRQTGDLYIGDVGQNQWEEVNYLPAGTPAGANFGWNVYEGNHPYSDTGSGTSIQDVKPVAEYDHNQGCSVTGGYVYRGSQVTGWQGVYLFGDYCSGTVWGLIQNGDGSWRQERLFENVGRISSFGEDQDGELYLVDISGTIYQLHGSQPQAGSSMKNQQEAVLPGASFDSQALAGAPQYTIDLNIDYTDHTFQGKTHILYTNREDTPIDTLYLRLLPNADNTYGNGSLEVSQVFVDGLAVESETSLSDTVLQVSLPEPLQPGESINIEMELIGIVPEDYGDPQNPTGYGIYNITDGVMALASFYPILAVYDEDGWNLDPTSPIGDSVYSDMAFYTVNLTVPEDLVVASTGSEVKRNTTNGQTTYQFVSGPARDFFLVMSPDFEVVSRDVDGTQVNSYYLPDTSRAGQMALDITADSLSTFNKRFGAYPYKELDVVQAPMQNAGGVEYPGIFLVADFLFKDPERPNFTIATAHETAHQWWYNLVGNDVFEDPWLDEGLTTYSSSLYYEDHKGQEWVQGLVDYWDERYQGLIDEKKDQPVAESLAFFENLNAPDIYGGVVYSKGGLFFHRLRQEIGDEAFFHALQDYYQGFQYRIARPANLLDAFEAAAGRSLDEFYQEWLYSPTP